MERKTTVDVRASTLEKLKKLKKNNRDIDARSIDDVIKIHDPALHLHLNILGIRSGFLGWSLLKSLFSQILGDCNCDSCVIMGLDPLTKLRY